MNKNHKSCPTGGARQSEGNSVGFILQGQGCPPAHHHCPPCVASLAKERT